MGVLKNNNIAHVYHYTPLHYLPFIGRSKSIRSKPSLRAAGFGEGHLRSMSKKQDETRGFGGYAHLTLEPQPPILKAKLGAGFPHIGLAVPVSAIEKADFDLCRFNVAMTRYLRRDGSPGFPESPTNGRYYGNLQIPVAKDEADKRAMLGEHLDKQMIEVLINGDLALPDDTKVLAFSDKDVQVAQRIIDDIGVPWTVEETKPPGDYLRSQRYAKSVETFIEKALANTEWRGDGLEFDRV